MKATFKTSSYSTSICPFQYVKCGEKEKKLQLFEYLERTKRAFQMNEKKISEFLKDYHLVKKQHFDKK